MRWERLFEDLEAQLATEERLDRWAEVPELIRADWARSTLRARLRVLRGREVRLRCLGVEVAGILGRLSREWFSLDLGASGGLVVRWDAVDRFHALPSRHDDAEEGVLDRLGLGHALRAVAGQRRDIVLTTMRAELVEGRIVAVGADYLDVREPSGSREVIAFSQVAMVRSADGI